MEIASNLHDLAKRELTAEVIRSFGEARLKVTGTSMLPSVLPGDVLIIRRRSGAELRVGQIILCYRDQAFIAHRLVAKLDDAFITRGDSLPYHDPPFRDVDILGEVTSILRDGRTASMRPLWWHRSVSWISQRSTLCTRIMLRLQRSAGLSWAR
jgi:hypothetical protein